MLVVDPQARITCSQLNVELLSMIKTAGKHPEYLATSGGRKIPELSQTSLSEKQKREVSNTPTQSPNPWEGDPLLRCSFADTEDRPPRKSSTFSYVRKPSNCKKLRNMIVRTRVKQRRKSQ